jgi:hypothetical protein
MLRSESQDLTCVEAAGHRTRRRPSSKCVTEITQASEHLGGGHVNIKKEGGRQVCGIMDEKCYSPRAVVLVVEDESCPPAGIQ